MLDRTNLKTFRGESGRGEVNHFIISTSHEKLSPAARKLIRSHVMRGKNRRKIAGSEVKFGTWINSGPEELEAAQECNELSYPRRDISGSGLSTLPYADLMQPYMYDLILICKPSPYNPSPNLLIKVL
jgi:hypothetical protein